MKSKIGLLTCAILLVLFSSVVLTVSATEQKTVRLTLEQVKTMAISNSNTLRRMQTDRSVLLTQYLEIKEQVEQLKNLHEVLPRYQYLYQKNQQTLNNPSYAAYSSLTQQRLTLLMELSTLSPDDTERLLEINAQIEGIDSDIALLGLTVDDLAKIITPQEVMELQVYATNFSQAGITSPNMSDYEEYKFFVEPVEIVPNRIITGVRKIDVAMEAARGSIRLGLDELCRTVQNLQEMKVLAQKNAEIAEMNKKIAFSKALAGMAVETDYQKALNNATISHLKLSQLTRQTDSLLMQCKYMLGLSNDVGLVLSDSSGLPQMKELNAYIEAGLANRNEIKILQLSIDEKVYELDLIGDYVEDSDLYKSVEFELALLKNELEFVKLEIEQELNTAYNLVLFKKQAYQNAEKALLQAKREYGHMVAYAAQGYISNNTLKQMSLMELQKEYEHTAALRDYAHALTALEYACQAGPAFETPEGGIQ